MIRRFLITLMLGVLFATPAQAQWRVAETRHFTIYSDGDEAGLREAAAQLEKYDFVLRAVSNVRQAHSPIKFKIYLMRSMTAVQATLPYGGGAIAGYYVPTPRGSFAVSTRRGPPRSTTIRTMIEDPREDAQGILLHEYAHHFMFQYFPGTYPTWYVEGFAEYYGSAAILDGDIAEIGHAPGFRMDALRSDWLPVRQVLTARSYGDVGGRIDLLYAEGWLLVHYLASRRGGAEELQRYLSAINAGQTYEAAMESVWGPGARELDSALRAYSGGRLTALRLPFRAIETGPIEIRALSPAEDALVRADIALSSGIPASDAARFAGSVRSAAAPHLADPYALRILAEAERIAGNQAAAADAVRRLLAIRPEDPKGLMLQGKLRIDALRAAASTDQAAWDRARAPLLQANRVAPRDPEVLLAYYESYRSQGGLPPPHAQNALVNAFNLIPQDDRLRYRVAADFEARGMIEDAIAVIRPAAFGLHSDDSEAARRRRARQEERYRIAGEERTETAREMLVRLEALVAARNGPPAAPAASPQ